MKIFGRYRITGEEVELDFDDIFFQNDDGRNGIVIGFRHNDVNVRTEHGRIIITPEAANSLYVETEKRR